MLFKLLLFSIILLNYEMVCVLASVSCLGENGQAVDWYIVYKIPDLRGTQYPYVHDGLGYMYMDSSYYQLNLSDKAINNTKSAVGYTLQQIYMTYQNTSELGFLMYNDEDPNGREPPSKGHTKGDIAFDRNSGFWLIHSAPRFPPFAKDSYSYPSSATRYGQSFICVTFNFTTFNDIGLQLLYNGPNIYDYGGSQSLINQLPNIRNVIDGQHVSLKGYSNVLKLLSLGGVVYTSFAKSKHFGKDLYHDLIAPFYKTNLLSETWQNGVGKLPSNCSEPTVENIEDLNLHDNITFTETKDHSKWAISKYSDLSIVCIGDINRTKAQFRRGGGTLCVKNSKIWNVFHDAVTKLEECEKQHETWLEDNQVL